MESKDTNNPQVWQWFHFLTTSTWLCLPSSAEGYKYSSFKFELMRAPWEIQYIYVCVWVSEMPRFCNKKKQVHLSEDQNNGD